MKHLIALAAAGLISASATVATADNHSGQDCASMLTVAIGHELQTRGIDTSNLCALSLGQVATIKSLLDTEGMTGESVSRIKRILGQ